MQLSWLEQLICNQQVVGSSPSIGSQFFKIMGRYSSGQRGQTVNLLFLTSQVRILLSPLKYLSESSSVGRASAFQAECRRFEPGLSLKFFCRCSSGVERFLGKEEVTSSNLVIGSSITPLFFHYHLISRMFQGFYVFFSLLFTLELILIQQNLLSLQLVQLHFQSFLVTLIKL